MAEIRDINITKAYLNFCLVIFVQSEFWSSDWSSLNFGPVMDGRTYRWKVMHMSPSCISTGVLKNQVLTPHEFGDLDVAVSCGYDTCFAV